MKLIVKEIRRSAIPIGVNIDEMVVIEESVVFETHGALSEEERALVFSCAERQNLGPVLEATISLPEETE